MEATGNHGWFRRSLGDLGRLVLLGDPAAIIADQADHVEGVRGGA